MRKKIQQPYVEMCLSSCLSYQLSHFCDQINSICPWQKSQQLPKLKKVVIMWHDSIEKIQLTTCLSPFTTVLLELRSLATCTEKNLHNCEPPHPKTTVNFPLENSIPSSEWDSQTDPAVYLCRLCNLEGKPSLTLSAMHDGSGFK